MRMEAAEVVVMFCGPHYGGKRHYGRIDKAIEEAKQRDCPLIVAGDGNFGEDVKAFVKHAEEAGVKMVLGAYDQDANTRGDARATAKLFDTLLVDRRCKRVYLVTDWYHMERARLALVQELRKRGLPVFVRRAPVWQHIMHGVRVLVGEVRGWMDYRTGREPRTWGEPIGKPVAEQTRID